MQNPNLTEGNMLPNKVEINPNVLRALMLDRIGGEVDSTDVVTIDQGGSAERTAKLLQKLSQPASFSYPICNSPIFSFCTGPRHCRPMLGRPGDKIVPEEHRITRGRSASVGAAGPVSISIDNKLSR